MQRGAAVVVAVMALGRPGLAACPPPDAAQLQARQAALAGIFEAHAPAMDLWWSGFMGLHMGMVAATGALAQHQAGRARDETLVSLVGSALGAGTLLLVTPPILEAPARLAPLPLDTPAQQAAWVALAERLLAEQANKSRFAKSWLARGLAAAYGVGASLFIWLVLDRPWGAVRQLVGGAVIGQGRIWLHPTGALEAWEDYQARYLEGCGDPASAAARAPARAVSLSFGAAPGGVGLTLSF